MVTLNEIAREAGFSLSTTAKILNAKDDSKFAETTRKKVMETARRLNYRPNVSARSMRSRRTNCMALLIRFGSRPNFPTNVPGVGFMVGVQEAFAEQGIHLMLVTVDEFGGGESAKVPLIFRESLVDGLVVEYGVQASIEKEILNLNQPVVWLNTKRQIEEDCVFPDESYNVDLAVEYLISKGYEHIIYVGNIDSISHFSSKLRYNIYQSAMKKRGRQPDVIAVPNHLEGAEVAAYLISNFPKVSKKSVLLTYDTMTSSLVTQAAVMSGKRIPHDFSIFTLDLNFMLLGSWPFFSGLVFDRKAMGRRAATMLIDKVYNNNKPINSTGFRAVIWDGESCPTISC